MITGSKEIGLMAKAFKAGATDFISKPLNKLELVARVGTARLLNLSLAKKDIILNELSQLTKTHFDEPFALKADGIADMFAMENKLLRIRSDRFFMTLFKLDISGLRGIHRTVSPVAFRHCMEVIGATAVRTTQESRTDMTYIGSGRFVGVCLDRFRFKFNTFTDDFNLRLRKVWETTDVGVSVAPTGKFSSISDQRIWSGTVASDAFRQALTDSKNFSDMSLYTEDNLFARLNTNLAGV